MEISEVLEKSVYKPKKIPEHEEINIHPRVAEIHKKYNIEKINDSKILKEILKELNEILADEKIKVAKKELEKEWLEEQLKREQNPDYSVYVDMLTDKLYELGIRARNQADKIAGDYMNS